MSQSCRQGKVARQSSIIGDDFDATADRSNLDYVCDLKTDGLRGCCLAFCLTDFKFGSMETTLTIRLPRKQRDALRRRAAAERRSESALVREMIDREMQREFDFERVRHLVGSIASQPKHWDKDSWRKHIRRRNWRS
jgi:hypothetical protein